MSDLSSQINSILSDPDMMEQIKSLSGLFGQPANQKNSGPENKIPDISPPPSAPPQLDIPGADGIGTVMKIMPLLNELKKDDETIKLLYAIKPFLSPHRQEKLEEAIRLLRIMRLIPILKSNGLFGLF